jgi:ubiquinone/menaquinone biosynthesis C-methylase UbiE
VSAENSSITTLVQSQFGPVAQSYVTSATHAQGNDLRRLVELAAPQGHERLLDVATGGGHTALAFAPYVAAAVALDLTLPMLQAARENITRQGSANITYCRAAAEELPFAARSFNLSVCRLAAHHFADARRYAAEVARTLQPGGLFLLADHIGLDDPELNAFMDRFERWRDPSHVRAYTLAEWQSFLEPVGLHIEHAEQGLARGGYPFAEWTARMRMADAERDALEQWLLAAEPRFRDFFAISADETGRLVSLKGNFGIIVACRAQ